MSDDDDDVYEYDDDSDDDYEYEDDYVDYNYGGDDEYDDEYDNEYDDNSNCFMAVYSIHDYSDISFYVLLFIGATEA